MLSKREYWPRLILLLSLRLSQHRGHEASHHCQDETAHLFREHDDCELSDPIPATWWLLVY